MRRSLRGAKSAIGTIALVAVFLGMFYGIYRLGIWLLPSVGGVFSHVSENIIVASIASASAIFGYWYTQRQISSRNIRETHRSAKIEVYDTFMDIIKYVLGRSLSQEPEINPDDLPEELQDLILKFTRGMIVWGSPEVIRAWLKIKRVGVNPSSEENILLLFDEILRAIRDDLDNSNRSLRKGDLVRLFLKDPDELKN